MIEVSEEELEAVHKWNCAMLLKRKQRACLCKAFCSWKRIFLESVDSKCAKIQNEIEQKNSLARKLSTSSHIDSTQSISQLQSTNQQLQRELKALQQEQADIEKATSKIRDTLKTLQTPSISSMSSKASRNPGTTSRQMSYNRYQYH